MSFTYGKPPPKIEGMVSLKVDNLTYRTTPDDLRRVFEKYGDVGDVYIPRDRWTRESRGFAFVRYYDKRDAEDAMSSLDGRMLDGRELRVQSARYGRPQSPQRRPGGGGRRRSRSRSPRRRSRDRSGDRDRGRRRSRSVDRRKRRSNSKSGSPAAKAKRDTSGTRDKRSRSPRSKSKSPARKSPDRRSRSRSLERVITRKISKSPSGSPRRSRSRSGNRSDKD